MTDVVLTAENVRSVLEVEDLLPAEAALRFFQVLRVILLARGDAASANTGVDDARLAAGVPPSAIAVRKRLPDRDEVLLVIAALRIASVRGPTSAAGPVLAIMRRFSQLDRRSGELSVVEVLGKGLSTPEEVHGRLHGRECPRPNARCVFLGEDLRCDISVDGITGVLEGLEKRQFVRHFGMNGEDLWEFSDTRLL